MEAYTKVYLLEKMMDDPRYEGFGTEGFFPQVFPTNRRDRKWKVTRLARTWRPLSVKGRVRAYNDYPCVGGTPAFSEKAVAALRDMLELNGELLPLESSLGTYFAYNVTTVSDVLDPNQSEIKWLQEPITALRIQRYEFIAAKLKGLSIFRIPESPPEVYVTNLFVERVLKANLKGFDLRLVWPLPKGVKWKDLAANQWWRRAQEGLPKGQWLKGNTVVIRLALSDKKATSVECKEIERIINEIDERLVDQKSESPALGNLEGKDFGVEGECRLFLSCPDADGLVNELRPWLKKLNWTGTVSVVKRYGQYMDAKASEEAAAI